MKWEVAREVATRMRLLQRAPDDEDVLRDFSDFLLLEEQRSDQTARGYTQQLKAVAKMLGKLITEVTPRDIRYEVKRDRTCAPSTLQLRITAYRQLHMWGLLDERPWASTAMLGVKSPPTPRRLPRAPVAFHVAQTLLVNCRSENEYRIVYLGLYAGLRVDEQARIRPDNWHRDRLTFIGKGDKERSVPVHPELAKVLPIILSKTPKNKGVLQSRMTQMRARLGIRDTEGKPATTHSLRRTCATFLYDEARVEREVVKMILGHGSEVTDLYAPVRFPRMREAIERIDYSIGTPVQLALF